jgi:hypothetical protein
MRTLLYILLASIVFSLIDWETVHLTRWVFPSTTAWMHAHEGQYALIQEVSEFLLCAPAIPLKPLFYALWMRTASQPEQQAITHAPAMNWRGFYRLTVRGGPWQFVSWGAWFLPWIVPSLLWMLVINLRRRRTDEI